MSADRILPSKGNFPAGRLINAGDEIEHGRFARAVRADEPDEFVAPDLQIQFRHRRQSAEADGGLVELQQRRTFSVCHAQMIFAPPNVKSPCGRVSIRIISSSE